MLQAASTVAWCPPNSDPIGPIPISGLAVTAEVPEDLNGRA